MNNYSPNMLKTFDDCQMKFFFKYVKKISVPQSAKFFEKGKKVHALANYYLKGFDVDKLETALNEDETKAWTALKASSYFDMEVVASEYNLSCKVGEYWVGGRLDAFMRKGDDYVILDYKTGSVPKNPQNDYQTMIYLICADKKIKKYNSLKFVYLDLKNNCEVSVDYDKSMETKVAEVCRKVDLAVSSNVFRAQCVGCEYDKICLEKD